ncbi:MAG: ribonucleoside-triphosphate reductase, adenosylcobalamin-dependent, partial [Prochlorococcaceae cyanobacterium]
MNSDFLASAPAANPVFYRSYSRRKDDGTRETFSEVSERVLSGLKELGKLTDDESDLISDVLTSKQMLPSGRWLWVGGTEWSKSPKNFSGAYNCTSTELVDWEAFGLMMDLAMMGSGTGAIIEKRFVDSLPKIRNRLQINEVIGVGSASPENRHENTFVDYRGNTVSIKVGDSRRGWVDAYQATIEAASSLEFDQQRPVELHIDLSCVRPAGERLKGFGGTSNPIKLQDLFTKLLD